MASKVIKTISSFIVALYVVVFMPNSVAEGRPNIIFIMSDDHATRAVSAYGDALVATPNIDRIATNGLRFDRAYVANALCGPSRATTLTGLHSHGNGFYSNEWSPDFDGNQQTFPRLLQAAGYQTAVIGKWHLYSDPVALIIGTWCITFLSKGLIITLSSEVLLVSSRQQAIYLK